MKNAILLIILCLSILSGGKQTIAQNNSIANEKNPTRKISVGVYQNNPKVFIDENGKPMGFWVEITNNIAKAQNWSINYIPCDWDDCLQQVKDGRLDIMVDVAYSEERDLLFDFNNEVVLASWSQVYARHGLTLNSILDLEHKKVGILKSSIQKDILEQQIKSFGITAQLVPVDNLHDIFLLLEQSKIDAGIVNNFFGTKFSRNYDIEKTNTLINPSRLHFIVAEGDPKNLLPSIDRELDKLIANSKT